MKKLFYFTTMSLMLLSLMTACHSGTGNSLKEERDSLAEINKQQALLLNGTNAILDDLSLTMDSVLAEEGQLFVQQNGEFINNRSKLKANVKAFGDLLARQREKIGEIESQLAKSKESAAKFQKLVAVMKLQLDRKSAEIADLQQKLDDANFDIENLNSHLWAARQKIGEQREVIQEQHQIIDTQDKMLNECYYIVGTKKELQSMGILSKGNIFKKSKADLGNIPQHLFHPVDIRRFRHLNLDGKKVKLRSPAPNGSYRIEERPEGGYTFQILDPNQFWSVSNYLIIQCD